MDQKTLERREKEGVRFSKASEDAAMMVTIAEMTATQITVVLENAPPRGSWLERVIGAAVRFAGGDS